MNALKEAYEKAFIEYERKIVALCGAVFWGARGNSVK